MNKNISNSTMDELKAVCLNAGFLDPQDAQQRMQVKEDIGMIRWGTFDADHDSIRLDINRSEHSIEITKFDGYLVEYTITFDSLTPTRVVHDTLRSMLIVTDFKFKILND